jgi:hypothetical protein
MRVREKFEQRQRRENPLFFAGERTGREKKKGQDLTPEQSLACAPAERKENLQENQSRQETVATEKKGINSFGCCKRKGKPRTLENNLMRSNSTKSKRRNTNEQDAKSIFSFKPTKLHQIYGVHRRPPSLI